MLEDLIHYTRAAYERGFVGGTGGNTSLRRGESFYITPTGCTLGEVDAEDLVEINVATGETHSGKRPSKEAMLHQAIYQARPDINTIFHLHPIECIAAILMLGEEELLPCYVPGHLKKIGRPPQVPYYPAGSELLAKCTAELFSESDCVWMRRHGIITGAKDPRAAFIHAEDMIDCCRLHLQLQGKNALSEDEIAKYIAK